MVAKQQENSICPSEIVERTDYSDELFPLNSSEIILVHLYSRAFGL